MASYEAKTFKGTMIYLKLSLHAKKSKFLEINCSHYQVTVLLDCTHMVKIMAVLLGSDIVTKIDFSMK